MKHFLFTSLIIFLFSSCKKEIDVQSSYSQIYGRWEYENYSGYPFNNNYQSPGNGHIIVFNPDRTFDRRAHDTVIFRGTYLIKEQGDCVQRENNTMLTTDYPLLSDGMYIKITGGQLELMSSGCLADGGTMLYRKLQ